MYKQIAANKRNTILLILGFVLFVGAIGALFAYYYQDWTISISTIVIAAIYAIIQYFAASKIAVMSTGAQKITKKDNPRHYNTVENLSITAGLPMPEVCIINDSAPNAFATGRDPEHAVVAATTGLLDLMDDTELKAVMAHEMSHVKNYDIRVSMITFGLTCVISFLADAGIRMLYFSGNDRDREGGGLFSLIAILVVSLVAPLVSSITQMAVSRQREFLADAGSVQLTRYPKGMISALQKLDKNTRPMQRQSASTESMYITNPLSKGFLTNLLSTHPPIEKRIERLENAF
jgi:heat shock protein HtpX